jgi:hypothetical protein
MEELMLHAGLFDDEPDGARMWLVAQARQVRWRRAGGERADRLRRAGEEGVEPLGAEKILAQDPETRP